MQCLITPVRLVRATGDEALICSIPRSPVRHSTLIEAFEVTLQGGIL
jgi:hypothetical protein